MKITKKIYPTTAMAVTIWLDRPDDPKYPDGVKRLDLDVSSQIECLKPTRRQRHGRVKPRLTFGFEYDPRLPQGPADRDIAAAPEAGAGKAGGSSSRPIRARAKGG